ncbi:uncharacterized protein NECHADRAFT_48560 [Fusarium vanettenii 77-13-4]|uniref:F-box domain-containing protein n=1 Tax=Fusarium vanettenii (strain ATCC MYA-4622 / CBS 123669 / FGSC 9596 / NRRL 45880 / 77-13-4) TaxID=660122 RepID=C7YUT7_FUSV7|nr:uncharacterized protein NECHADRAFT_48560 [Fusarium vanettenii 77-13-4]EEU44467.1 hypothetical protein NECHADRAFT_48560 [Fusarium vanettenii 77-13-4]
MSKASSPPSAPFLRLPNELVGSICHLLPNSDIKNLRLTCRFFAEKAQLRLRRVFISPGLHNLDALRGIADHDTFRRDVEEIIWDDATLKPIQREKGPNSHGWDPDAEDSDEEEEPVLQWFVRLCKISIAHLKSRMMRQNRPDTVARQEELANAMSFRESLKHYRVLVLQQQYIFQLRADEDAFRYALRRFPRLKRVTVTPAAHGFLFEPLYKTPMIRNLPYGFLYPIPRGWQVPRDGINRDPVSPWDGDGAIEKEKDQWRGFRIATRILAEEQHHHVSELIFDNHKITTGINHFAFHPPSEEYHNFCTILKRPGFRRVEVSLLVGYLMDEEADGWDTYRNGDLYKALAGAPDLEHVGLQSDYEEHGYHTGGSMEEFVSLFSVFPIDRWTKLRHFGLSRMQVAQDDLVSFLAKLPSTLESVELSFLAFLEEQGNYCGLLSDIRDKLGWRDRPVDAKVKICVLITFNQANREGRYIRLNKEVQDYVYGSGPPPFSPRGYIGYGTGVQQDEFNPHWERPYEKPSTLERLGY